MKVHGTGVRGSSQGKEHSENCADAELHVYCGIGSFLEE